MSHVLAIDIGTSRIKTACFDESGCMTHLASRRLDRAASPVTQDAQQWYSVTAKLLKQTVEKLSRKPDAVVMTGNMHALLGIDKEGNPVSPALLWSDNSAQKESDFLNKHYKDALLKHCGNSSTPVFTLPKILQMQHQNKDLYRKSTTFMQSKDYISLRLTGNRVTDPVDGSGVLGMDLQSNSWMKDFFDELNIDLSKLPEIMPSASICGYVTQQAAEETGIAAGTPVITGTGDLSSAAIGSGVDNDTVSLTLGTAGQLLAVGKKNQYAELAGKLFVFANANPEQNLFLGSVPAGGFSFEWLAKLHNLTVPQFFKLAAAVPLAVDLPLFMPYILGKGAPSMDYTPCGAWLNLNASHSIEHICKGAVFGTLSPLRQCTDLLEILSGKRSKVILQALACRENAVKQTACELFLQKKYIPENSEASLLGAAVIAAVALKAHKSFSDASKNMIRHHELLCNASDTAQVLFARFLERVTLE